MKLCLGIESTAHTFGAGIVSFDGKVLCNVKEMFTTEKGGMIPMEVAKHHEECKERVIENALKEAKVSWDDIDLISVASSPGLPPALRVGVKYAKQLAKEKKIPLIGINHCVAHLTIGNLMTKLKDCVYLYVSGANTQIIAQGGDRFRIFGETIDIAIGNALDKFGREVGLGFPAGPKIEELAKKGKYVELPYVVKGMDLSLSGLITRAKQLFDSGTPVEDLCFSLQETAFAMLAEVCERALAHCEKSNLILIGGVAANQRLCKMLDEMCKARGATFGACPFQFAGDQGVMIAWQGILEFEAGRVDDPDKLDFDPVERTDDVVITWKN
jgi:glycoprotease/Kae1 family metallohydrolase